MTGIAAALRRVQQRILTSEQRFQRPPGSVSLLAVSKAKPARLVREAAEAGQAAFGENYVQEAVAKIDALQDLELHWHFIGPVQSNKTRVIAARFLWVHSVDRLKIARRLSLQRSGEMPPLNVCLQVNVSGESSKSGVTPDALMPLALAVADLPHLRLRGLMAIPRYAADFDAQRAAFRAVRAAFEALNAQGLALDTLSMGMTNDMEAAIAEGATLVRIGTAIFGPREKAEEHH